MEVCPFHADEGIVGVPVGSDGTLSFTCDRTRGHPVPGPHTWMFVPAPPELEGMSGLGAELGLHVELPALMSTFRGSWVEFGVVEHAYAEAHPEGLLQHAHNASDDAQQTPRSPADSPRQGSTTSANAPQPARTGP